MSHSAHISSVAVLRELRVALVKFGVAAQNALAEADSDLHRTIRWVQQDQAAHWEQQLRRRAERLVQAEQVLKNKKYHFRSDLDSRSCVDEERAVVAARRAVEEAREKSDLVRRWGPKLEKQALLYRGAVNGLIRAAETDVPRALAGLDRMLDSLENYLAAPGAETAETDSVARGTLPEEAAEMPVAPSNHEVQAEDEDASGSGADHADRGENP